MITIFYRSKRVFPIFLLLSFFVFPGILTASESYKILVLSSKFFLGQVDEKYLSAGKKILTDEFSRRSSMEGEDYLKKLIESALNPVQSKSKQKTFIDCKAKCLEGVRKILKEEDLQAVMLLTIAQKNRKIRLQLLLTDHQKTRIESSFCENCNNSKFKTVLLQLVQKTFDYNQTSLQKNEKPDQPLVEKTPEPKPETPSVRKKKKNISLYYPSNYEVDTLNLFKILGKRKGLSTSLPVLLPNGMMKFIQWKLFEPLRVNTYGFLEPLVSGKSVNPDFKRRYSKKAYGCKNRIRTN